MQEILNDDLSEEEQSLIVNAYTVYGVEAAKNTIIEGREEVYTLLFSKDGEDDYRNIKAVHPGEAREAFLNFIRQENLDVDVIFYDDDTNTFRAFGGQQEYYFLYSKDGEFYIDGTKAQHPGEALEIIRDYIEGTDLEVTNLFYEERTNTFHGELEDNSGVKTDETVYESLPEELSWDEISDEADELAEQYKPLFEAQDKAIVALKSLGITSERLFDEIREATSVEEVEQRATSILETRKQQLLQNPEAVKALALQRLEADGGLTENQRALLTDAETHEEIAQASEVVTVQREVISNLNEGLAEDLSSEEEELITNTSSVEEVQLAAENILNAREQKALQEAKNAAIDQIDANEAESARINQATSVEEVSEAVEAIQSERAEKVLQNAKEAAIEELEANEAESARINQANSVEEVGQAVEAIKAERAEKALQDAKDAAIKELEDDGETTEEERKAISDAESIEEVQEIKEDILDSRKTGWDRFVDLIRRLLGL